MSQVTKREFYRELLEKIKALPGVKTAAIDDDVPFSGFRAVENFAVTGQPEPRHGEEPSAETHCVSPDYFTTMGIPILRGRSFGPDDVLGKPLVILIDEYLAEKFFPGRDPIGEQLNQERAQTGEPRVHYTIVGVVPSVRRVKWELRRKSRKFIGQQLNFRASRRLSLFGLRLRPPSLLPSVRAAVHSIDPPLPIFATRTMDESRRREHWDAAAFRNVNWRVFYCRFVSRRPWFVCSPCLFRHPADARDRNSDGVGFSANENFRLNRASRYDYDCARHSCWHGARARVQPFNPAFCVWRRAARSEDDHRRLVFVVRSCDTGLLGAGRRAIRVDPIVALRQE